MFDRIIDAILEGSRNGSLLQGILTVGLIALYALLVEQNKVVPSELVQWSSLVIGFYFGGKAQGIIATALRSKE